MGHAGDVDDTRRGPGGCAGEQLGDDEVGEQEMADVVHKLLFNVHGKAFDGFVRRGHDSSIVKKYVEVFGHRVDFLGGAPA